MSITKPFMKWVGGKTQILPDVLSLFPSEVANYHEPFVGGGSVLLGFLSYVRDGSITLRGNVYASDLNSNLIALYKNIQSHPETFIQEVKILTEEFQSITGGEVNRTPTSLEEALTSPESYYFWIRSRFNSQSDKSTVLASAMLLFMNKTCFRGLYREGPRGYNVPFGNYKNPCILEEDHIRNVSTLIQNVVFTVNSYRESLQNALPGDFVYLDPPYAPESATSFVGYTADGFGVENHEALFKLCNDMNSIDVKFVMSNADVPLVKNVFPTPTYTTKIISCRRAINSKNPESRTNELLITNQSAR